jgi:hypothetical protein
MPVQFAKVLAEFPHLAGDNPQGLAHTLEVARGAWSNDDYAALEAHYQDLEARVARAQRIIASYGANMPGSERLWETVRALGVEYRGYDEPTSDADR